LPTDPDQRIAALARQEAQKIVGEQLKQVEAAKAQEVAQAAAQERVAKAVEKYPDYVERLTAFDAEGYQVAQDVVEAIALQPDSADLLYYIASHPEEAAQLAPGFGTPSHRLFTLLRMQQRVQVAPAAAPAKVTAAPAPTPHQRGSAAANPSLDQMTDAQFIAFRNKQLRGK